MFVGCFEISISVIVKNVLEFSGLFVYLVRLVKILIAWGDKKNAGLWFAWGGISTQDDTMCLNLSFNTTYVYYISSNSDHSAY